MTTVNRFTHDPNEKLDYTWPFIDLLMPGETISTASFPPVTGVTVSQVSTLGATVTAWLVIPAQGNYWVACHIVTSTGREYERSIWLVVEDQ